MEQPKAPPQDAAPRRKNLPLVSFDDAVAPWRYKTAFGTPLRVPNLDKLCTGATAFKATYAQAPICGPSRASAMTTTWPHETGVLDNSLNIFERVGTERFWISRIKAAGYYTSSGGKIHHSPTLARPYHRALYSDARKAFSVDLRLPREIRKGSLSFGGHRDGRATRDGEHEDFYFDRQSADSAIDFLQSYEGEAPFFRELGLFSPHAPHITPARFKEMYDVEAFRRPADWAGYLAETEYIRRHIPENEAFRDEDHWRKSVRNYFSAYSHGDYHLGRVLGALARSAHARNTLIVVFADHGFHLGNRNLFRKTTLWEQSLNVPLIIFDPDNPTPREITDPVALISLGPTILDLLGIEMSPEEQALSLRPMLYGARAPERVVPSFYKRSITIRKGRHRIIRYADGSFQLFDVEEDPWQLRDLGAGDAAFGPMRAALEAWAGQNGYTFSEPGSDDGADEPEHG